jgi:hypothetical protein
MKTNLLNKINSLEVGAFVSKENLNLDTFSIEPSISRLRKLLKPKEFKSVSKHLVRIK